MSMPVFSSKNIPGLFKAGLALAFTIILYQTPDLCSHYDLAIGTIPFCIGLAGEIVIGFIIGISAQLIFAGIQLGGQIIGFQMGLSIANILDPLTSSQVSVTARFNDLMAMLIFLAVNAHYLFLRAIAESFQILPPLGFQFTRSLMDKLIVLAGNMFVIAIRVAGPVMGVLLLVSVALGLIARMVPQLNVFIVAMPLKIIIGLFIMGVSASLVASFFIGEFNELGHIILVLLRAAGAKSP